MSKPKVFVQKPWEGQSTRMFERLGFPLVPTPEECDIICFNGGEDINPKLYGETPLPEAHVCFDQRRDEIELEGYKRATGKFKFGICRGGQLLNVLNGGRLWQDVNNHDRAHDMVDLQTGRTIWASSIHHQQFILGEAAEVVAVATIATTKYGMMNGKKYTWWRDDDTTAFNDDPEVVWYPKDRALCIQGHPEYSGYSQMTEYCMDLIERYY